MSRTIQEAVAACYDNRKATARKSGRNPRFPYVPVIHHTEQKASSPDGRTEIIRGRAFATREEAIAYAGRVLDAWREKMAADLARPERQLYREQWGVEL